MTAHELHEILPGVLHWTSFHDGINAPVSSYLVEPAGVVIDPRLPDSGLEALDGREPPQQAILTTGLHHRDADRFAEAFGCVIRAPAEARDRLGDALAFDPFEDGDEIAADVIAVRIGALAPDEYALHLTGGDGAIVLADALMHYGDTLAFVPDSLMGEHSDRVKEGLTDALHGLLVRDFDHLFFAHGDPIVGGAKAALRDFLS